MVPLGPLAFQPGFIHHTNEITVLLGDNLFVERAAVQAAEIIRRRQAYLAKQMETVESQIAGTQSVDDASKQMFGGGGGGGTTSKEKSHPQQDDDSSSSSDAAGPLSGLGISFKDGKMRNEEGEEIIEIKEDFFEDEEIEEKDDSSSSSPPVAASASSVAPSASSSSSSSSAPAASSQLDFPSVLDQNFDQFWEELADLEKEHEAVENANKQPALPAAHAAAPSDSASVPDASASELLPVPSPPLRPISSPADIFRHITQAKIKAGETVSLPPRPAAAAAAVATSPSVRTAAAAAAAAATTRAAAASTYSVSAAAATSQALDSAFADYKQARRDRKQARLSSSGKKRVVFASDVRGGGDSDSESEEEMDKGRPIPASTHATARASVAKTGATAAPASAKPIAGSTSSSTRSAFSGEIHERPAAAAPVTIAASTTATARTGPRPLSSARPLSAATAAVPSGRPSAPAVAAAAAPQKLSKFKMKMMGLQTDDD